MENFWKNPDISNEMRTAYLVEAQNGIDKQIENLIQPEVSGSIKFFPIKDGIIDCSQYAMTSPRIMWVLREIHNDAGEVRSIRYEVSNFKTNRGMNPGYARTYGPLVYVTYGILNGKRWETMDYIKDNPDMIDVLQKTAIINVRKVPNHWGIYVDWDRLNNSFQEARGVLRKQIELANPDIIICAGTYSFVEQLGLENKFLLNAYHPSARIKREMYVNSLIDEINKWLSRNK